MRRSILLVAAAGLGFAGLALTASATRAGTQDFHLIDQAVEVDHAEGTATFRLSFDREPRFFRPHGGGGDQPNAFQIEVDVDNNTFERPLEWEDIDSVIRGAEISAGNGIPIRDREGDGGNGQTGGWGPVRALVPFDVDGSTLTFTAGLGALGDSDGKFRYRVITTDGGSLTSQVNAAIIPLPAAVWGGAMLLGAAAGVALRARKRLS